ncbi:hypothetical protein EYC84_004187 [Monilinia fructicola]|uniref:Uncharacterized protein n=1 Tax=Monilinia fructicola TaxID=38448 RepID=A0A5M9K2A8_MONFR|nr:hypothetical protein EYC84_004187 [Monilinia fructicola]
MNELRSVQKLCRKVPDASLVCMIRWSKNSLTAFPLHICAAWGNVTSQLLEKDLACLFQPHSTDQYHKCMKTFPTATGCI